MVKMRDITAEKKKKEETMIKEQLRIKVEAEEKLKNK